MNPQLKVKLFRGWTQIANPNGPATYVRGNNPDSCLQFSFATYLQGALPNTTEELLIRICEKMAGKIGNGTVVLKSSGKCAFGLYGSVIAKAKSPAHFQIWVVSDQQQFILITHTCANEPIPDEMSEANEMALMTGCE